MPILTRYSEADWDVRRRSDAFDVAKMHKARRRAEKGLGNCISRIVPITPHAPDHWDADFYLTAEIITLSWISDDAPAYSPHDIWHVEDSSAQGIIDAWLNAPALLAKEMRRAAKEARSVKWRSAKNERKRVLDQIHRLMPITKSVFGKGAGEEIRRIALVKPQQQVKLAKGDPAALARMDLTDRFWDEAYQRGLPRPQYVKI